MLDLYHARDKLKEQLSKLEESEVARREKVDDAVDNLALLATEKAGVEEELALVEKEILEIPDFFESRDDYYYADFSSKPLIKKAQYDGGEKCINLHNHGLASNTKAIALAHLRTLRTEKRVDDIIVRENGDWQPDFNDSDQPKYYIANNIKEQKFEVRSTTTSWQYPHRPMASKEIGEKVIDELKGNLNTLIFSPGAFIFS